ncbi:hypothetical protein Tco_0306229 [Tanacetum coccineum]
MTFRVQKRGGSKQVRFKQLGSKQVGFKQLGVKQVGFKQLGHGVETGVHGVHDEKRIWFEVELPGAQGDCEAEVFQVYTTMYEEWRRQTFGCCKDTAAEWVG